MKTPLIVIEGTDGSGKQTQTELLCAALEARGVRTLHLSFPRYDDAASIGVRRYLSGAYGAHPEDVSAYQASALYALDRFDAFARLDAAPGTVIVSDRYTTSNMIHQASKLHDPREQAAFLDWLEDYEYRKLGIPEPDLVFFLNMPPDVSQALVAHRGGPGDIHEKDAAYLRHAHQTGLELSARCGWQQIDCAEGGAPKAVGAIHEALLARTLEYLNQDGVRDV